MSGIYISGMEMPTVEQGVRTINIYADGVVTNYAEVTIGTAIPIPPGRLIDADALIKEMKCSACVNERYCYDGNHQLTRDGCADNGFVSYAPMTWGDKIRSESDEGLAGYCSMYVPCFLCPMTFECDGRQIGKDECLEKWVSYIKSPVEADE